MLSSDINTISASEKFVDSLKTLNSVNITAECYDANDLRLTSGNIKLRSLSSDGGSADLIDIGNFVIARLSIDKAENIPADFECHLLIANSKALPFIDKYNCKYFILSEPLSSDEYISNYLAERQIIYLGDFDTDIALINGKLHQKSKTISQINSLFK